MGAFKNWNDYGVFAQEIARQRRYIRTARSEEFLRAVAATCGVRAIAIQKDKLFWRAQLGNDWDTPEGSPGFEQAVCFSPKRMKPLSERAFEGRVNPKGIPCLYLSTTKQAAMSEVRPWVGAMVSVAQFKTVRTLTLVNCSLLHDKYFNLLLDRKFGEPMPPEKIDQIVWAAIDRAFADPVTRADDEAEYAATQTIADLFRSQGYDGVAYKSAFGDDGFSLALFDLNAAKQVNGLLFETKKIDFSFDESGNPYFITE